MGEKGREVGGKGEGSGGKGGGKWGERGRELGMGYPPVQPLVFRPIRIKLEKLGRGSPNDNLYRNIFKSTQ